MLVKVQEKISFKIYFYQITAFYTECTERQTELEFCGIDLFFCYMQIERKGAILKLPAFKKDF